MQQNAMSEAARYFSGVEMVEGKETESDIDKYIVVLGSKCSITSHFRRDPNRAVVLSAVQMKSI